MMRVLIPVVMLAGCGQCYDGFFANVTHYSVHADARTPEGIAVDDSGQAVDLGEIDARTDALETCLRGVHLSDAERLTAYCIAPWPDRIDRSCVTVKVAPDWYIKDGEEVFSCDVPDYLCEEKGHSPPCACRAIVQDQDVVVTAPNLHLFAAELERMVTGCDDVWSVPALAECATS